MAERENVKGNRFAGEWRATDEKRDEGRLQMRRNEIEGGKDLAVMEIDGIGWKSEDMRAASFAVDKPSIFEFPAEF